MSSEPPSPPAASRSATADDFIDPDVGSLLSRFERGEEISTEEILARSPRLRAALAPPQDLTGALKEGFQLGPFRLGPELGRGGMGVVHEAIQEPLGRIVALKILRTSLFEDDEARQRFEREAASVASLHHPGLCTVHAAGVDQGIPWIAMRRLKGPTLAGWLRAAGPPKDAAAVRRVVEWVAGAARALQVAHDAGIIHRDLKPGNLMLDEDDQAVVVDFGLAHIEDADAVTLTEAGALFGTPQYLAPEQLAGRIGRPDARADVWALGIVLYELLSGQPPFEAPTRQGLFRKILETEAPRLDRTQRRISKDLGVVIATALAKEPDRRYARAIDLADDLDAILSARPIRARAPSIGTKTLRWMRRHPAESGLIFALCSALLVAGVLGGQLLAKRPLILEAEEELRRTALERRLEHAYALTLYGQGREALAAFRELALEPLYLSEAIYGQIQWLRRDGQDASILELIGSLPAELQARPVFRRIAKTTSTRLGQVLPDAVDLAPRDALDHFFECREALWDGFRGDMAAAQRAHAAALRAILLSERPRALHYDQLAASALALGDHALQTDAARALEAHWPQRALTWSFIGLLRARLPLGETRGSGPIYELIETPKEGERDLSGASQAFEKAIALDPSHWVAVHNLGLIAAMQGQRAEAEALLRRTAALAPDIATPWLNLGSIAIRAGELESGLAAYDEGLVRMPGHPLLLRERSAALRELKRPEAALVCAGDLIARAPTFALGWLEYGVVLLDLKRFDEARQAFERSIALDPTHGLAHNNLGVAHLRLGQRDQAIAALKAGVLADPSFAMSQRNLGMLLLQSGDPAAALPPLETALSLSRGQDLQALLSKARALAVLSRIPEAKAAIAALRAASASLPDDRRESLQTILNQLQSDLDAAQPVPP